MHCLAHTTRVQSLQAGSQAGRLPLHCTPDRHLQHPGVNLRYRRLELSDSISMISLNAVDVALFILVVGSLESFHGVLERGENLGLHARREGAILLLCRLTRAFEEITCTAHGWHAITQGWGFARLTNSHRLRTPHVTRRFGSTTPLIVIVVLAGMP